jgi:hypothetical protein
MRLNVVTAGQLIHMLGHNSNRHFHMDAGASYSILPHQSSLPATGLKLFSLASKSISGWGGRLVQLRSHYQNFSWKFLLAKAALPYQKLLAAPYAGPYQVVTKGAKTFTIQIGHRQEIVTEDCLKAQAGSDPVSPAEAASYGCPSKRLASPTVQPATS